MIGLSRCLRTLKVPIDRRSYAPLASTFLLSPRNLRTASPNVSRTLHEGASPPRRYDDGEKPKQVERGLPQDRHGRLPVPRAREATPARDGERRKVGRLADKHTAKTIDDPVHMLKWTREKLRQVDAGQMTIEAIETVLRPTSHRFNVVASWNVLFGYILRKGEPGCIAQVSRSYRDFRKTGLSPDSYTYMALFTGYAELCEHTWKQSNNPKGAATTLRSCVEKTLSFWHSLSLDSSPIEPEIILTNAALNACARAGDIKAMWEIIDKVPEQGKHSLDGKSYSILLTAVRRSMSELNETQKEIQNRYCELRDNQEMPGDLRTMKARSVKDGKRIWAAVLHRWKAGEIDMDARLTVAMAKILLESNNPDEWGATLSLVNQVTNVPCLSQKGKSRARPKQPRKIAELTSDIFAPLTGDRNPSLLLDRLDSFDQNLILSACLEACVKTSDYPAAKAYWKLFIDQSSGRAFEPDSQSLDLLLRMCRKHRDSQTAREALDAYATTRAAQTTSSQTKWLRYPTARLAMSTCVRDSQNPHVFDTATHVLDLMFKHLYPLDQRTADAYLGLALELGCPKGKKPNDDILSVALAQLARMRYLLKRPSFQNGSSPDISSSSSPDSSSPRRNTPDDTCALLTSMRALLDASKHISHAENPDLESRLRYMSQQIDDLLPKFSKSPSTRDMHTAPTRGARKSPRTSPTSTSFPQPHRDRAPMPSRSRLPFDDEALPEGVDNRMHVRARQHLDRIASDADADEGDNSTRRPPAQHTTGTMAERFRRQIRSRARQQQLQAFR